MKKFLALVVFLTLVVPSAGGYAAEGYIAGAARYAALWSAPADYAAVSKNSRVVPDRSGYTPVSNREALIELMEAQTKRLAPEAKARIQDYSDEGYSADWCGLFPLEQVEINGTVLGKTAEITYTLTYTQAERVLFNLQGGKLTLTPKERHVANKARDVFNSIIKEDMTKYEKQLAIHDYLVTNVAYDKSARPPDDAYDPYGALIDGKAVCQGYTEAARVLLSLADIPNYTLSGTADGAAHIWNVVEMGGALYHMDVTWDAGLVFEDGSRALSRAYFNLTDGEMAQSHQWDETLRAAKGIGACDADEYNYFILNRLVVTSNSEYEALAARKYAAGKKEVEVLFDGVSIEDADILAAAKAAGAEGYVGFPNPTRNVLWVRFF